MGMKLFSSPSCEKKRYDLWDKQSIDAASTDWPATLILELSAPNVALFVRTRSSVGLWYEADIKFAVL